LAYQLLLMDGDDVAAVIAHMRDLEYIPPLAEDVEELRTQMRRLRPRCDLRTRYGLQFLGDKTPSADFMRWLVETPAARTCTERLLLDHVQPEHVATIIGLKFGCKMSKQAIEYFRDGFWDTALLTHVDFNEYFRLGARTKPAPPPEAVSLVTRPQYAAWKQGLQPTDEELSPETMVREVQVDAFMRFKELSSRADFQQAKPWAELLLKTASARRGLNEAKVGSGDILAVRPILQYPEPQTPTLGELHSQYAEAQSGTGAVSAAAGARAEDDTKSKA
jgi:hypothetical protein